MPRGERYWSGLVAEGYNERIGAVAAIVSQHLEEALTARFGWRGRPAMSRTREVTGSCQSGYLAAARRLRGRRR